MADPPRPQVDLAEQYGPTLNYTPPGGWRDEAVHGEEALVKTHCCFCGQQCGIQLKVRDNQVIGFEPWEEFPFNRGMLCPKGVKRYMQANHPDRLLDPLIRTDSGFRTAGWEEAMSLTARRIQEIQQQHGPEAVGMLGGASLTTEKAYLLGKFARVALQTPFIDYNGRLCMVSAGTAYKLTCGIDRAMNPWEDIPKSDVLMICGSNTAECSPITTSYVWKQRDNGGRLIVSDPRMTPITRNCDLYLPVRPGTDLALHLGMLHVILRDKLHDEAFLAEHCNGFDAVAEHVQAWDPLTAAHRTGVPPEAIEKAARWIAEADAAMILHARGIEHQSKGVENCLSLLNIALATGNVGRPGAGCMMITGQGNGQGGREHGQKCDQLPGARSITDPAAREHVAKVWGVEPDSLPGPGVSAVELIEKIHAGEIKALLSICFNPVVSLPDSNYVKEALSKLEFFAIIDFFMAETAHFADVVLPGSLQEEDEGVVGNVEGRVIHIRQAVTPPGNAKRDWEIYLDLARRLGKGDHFAYDSPRAIFDELREASRGGTADYYGITYEKIDAQMGVFWPCPELDHPGTPRLFEDKRSYHDDGRFHLQVTEWRDSGDPVDDDYPVYLTTGRVVSQYLSGTQTRRIGALVDQYPHPRLELHPRLAERYGIADGDWVSVTTRRGEMTLQAMVVRTIRPDTVFIPYHWPGRQAANQLTHRTLDPRSKIPEYKVSACQLKRTTKVPEWAQREKWEGP